MIIQVSLVGLVLFFVPQSVSRNNNISRHSESLLLTNIVGFGIYTNTYTNIITLCSQRKPALPCYLGVIRDRAIQDNIPDRSSGVTQHPDLSAHTTRIPSTNIVILVALYKSNCYPTIFTSILTSLWPLVPSLATTQTEQISALSC